MKYNHIATSLMARPSFAIMLRIEISFKKEKKKKLCQQLIIYIYIFLINTKCLKYKRIDFIPSFNYIDFKTKFCFTIIYTKFVALLVLICDFLLPKSK